MPDWYPLVRAAKYLGVPPWELADQPMAWQMIALICEQAEAEAEEIIAKRAQKH
jgi:hypothetical protein